MAMEDLRLLLRSDAMNKYAVCLCLTATCTFGCTSLARRTQTETHFFTASQAVTATSLKPALAKLAGSPGVDPAKDSSANRNDVKTEHPPSNATLKNSETTPAVSQKHKEAVTVAGLLTTT